MGGEQPGPSVVRELRAPEGLEENPRLILQEVFAGTGRVTEAWKKGGVAKEPTTDEVTEQNTT